MAESAESPGPDPLARAESVTLILHGVGDHSAVDIRGAARRGLAIAGLDSSRIQDVEIPDFPRFPEASPIVSPRAASGGSQPGLEAVAGQGRHLLIPLVWSGMRPRAARWAGSLGPMAGLQTLMVALPSLILLWWDVLRCVPRGRRLWKLALAAASLGVGGAIVAFTMAAFWVTVKLPTIVTASDLDVLIYVAAGLAMVWVIHGFSSVLDLTGDVARYVASDVTREDAVRNLRGILETVSKRAPDATILLVSHSLGSVLASEVLAQLPSIAPGRTLLVTLGSPLRSMSRIFPGVVKTPADLASAFMKQGTAELWMNFWREEDWIGKALSAGGPKFIESSLGAGLHPNYWSDERVWKALSLALLGPPPEGQTFESLWKAIPLTSEEGAEFRRRGRGLLQPFSVLLLALFVSLVGKWIYVPSWPDHHALWSRWVLRAASMMTMGLLAISWYLARSAGRGRASERQWLWDLRSAHARCWMLIGLAISSSIAVFLLDRVARAHVR